MTTRSHIIGLMERKAAAGLVAERTALAGLVRQSADAERMAGRLAGMLEDRRIHAGDTVLAADFRLGCRLGAEIAAESLRQSERAADLEARVAAQRETLAMKDRKRELLAEARIAARQAEAEDREARQAAALPPRRAR